MPLFRLPVNIASDQTRNNMVPRYVPHDNVMAVEYNVVVGKKKTTTCMNEDLKVGNLRRQRAMRERNILTLKQQTSLK